MIPSRPPISNTGPSVFCRGPHQRRVNLHAPVEFRHVDPLVGRVALRDIARPQHYRWYSRLPEAARVCAISDALQLGGHGQIRKHPRYKIRERLPAAADAAAEAEAPKIEARRHRQARGVRRAAAVVLLEELLALREVGREDLHAVDKESLDDDAFLQHALDIIEMGEDDDE